MMGVANLIIIQCRYIHQSCATGHHGGQLYAYQNGLQILINWIYSEEFPFAFASCRVQAPLHLPFPADVQAFMKEWNMIMCRMLTAVAWEAFNVKSPQIHDI